MKKEIENNLLNVEGTIYGITSDIDNIFHNYDTDYSVLETVTGNGISYLYQFGEDNVYIKLKYIKQDSRLNNIYEVVVIV